jgi:hypothetical protein
VRPWLKLPATPASAAIADDAASATALATSVFLIMV